VLKAYECVGAVNSIDSGTFVAMNGKVMNPEHCVKNPETGAFEEMMNDE